MRVYIIGRESVIRNLACIHKRTRISVREGVASPTSASSPLRIRQTFDQNGQKK